MTRRQRLSLSTLILAASGMTGHQKDWWVVVFGTIAIVASWYFTKKEPNE